MKEETQKNPGIKKKVILVLVVVIVLVVGLTACGQESKEEKGPVTVATMIDSEGAVLGNMLILLLEEAGYKVVDKVGLGTPDILRKALEAGEVDLVIDYTGSGQYYGAVADEETWSDPQKGYETTKKFDKDTNNIYWLTPANANNTEMLAVKEDFAIANGLKSVADLARYVNNGGEIKLISSASFAEKMQGLLGYQEAYGFSLKKDQLIILSHGNTAEMLKALHNGTDGVNVSLVYGTDGSLQEMNMIVLDDPKNIPPVYLPTPVLRGDLAEKYPELQDIFTETFKSLTLEKLQTLNARIAFGGENAKDVAKEYLEKNNILK